MEDFKDFKIRRGLSTTLFSSPGVVNNRMLIEEGYWYLCTDTAELYLGVKNKENSELGLVRVNAKDTPTKLSELINDCELITKAEVDEALGALNIPEAPTKISELENDLGFLTEHQDLSAYAKREELPSIIGLASEEFVTESIAAIKIPETDLSEYSTTSEVTAAIESAVTEKANEIPFTTTKVVGNQLGNFNTGEDLKGLTVAEIFAKLLGLSDNSAENPELPDGSQGIVADIITKQIPMHAITTDGTLEEVPYKLLVFTEEQANLVPTESSFYQIKDASGIVIESGYQLLSNVYLDMPFLISLPKAIDFNTHIETQAWNVLEQCWETKSLSLSSDIQEFIDIMGQSPYDIFTNVDPENYVIWFNSNEGSTGTFYRFIIHE